MGRSVKSLVFLAAIILLVLAPAVLGQLGVNPTSMVYIQVEPQGLGEVGYYPSFGGPAREWPRATTPIGSFFTMAFTQGTYLYLEAKPYGCAELDRWEITPEDVNKTYAGSREKLIIILDRDYITVEAVFRKIPEDKCPYIPVWGSIRIRKDDLWSALIVVSSIGSVTAVTYKVKKARDRRRAEENERRFWIERIREKLLENTVDWRRPAMIEPWQVILWTSFKRPSLEEASIRDLERSLLDDETLDRLRDIQASGMAGIADNYISKTLDIYMGHIPLLGLKTYLALFNLAPSTDEITKMYIGSLDRRRVPTLWHHMDGEKALEQILSLIGENIQLQKRGLQKVFHLMNTNPEYRRRIRIPHEFYETILAFIEEWMRERFGRGFDGVRVRPEMKNIGPYWGPQAYQPAQKLEEPAREEHREEVRQEDVKLPETPPPKHLVEALEEEKREREEIRKELARAEEEERVRKVEGESRVAVASKPLAERVGGPRKPVVKPPTVKVKIPVKWDELPRQLQRQIEDLGLGYEEVASIALRTMGKSEREVYREANKLIAEKYPGMDESSVVPTLLMIVNVISWLQNIMGEKGAGPEPLEEHVEAPKPSEAGKPVDRLPEPAMEEVEEAPPKPAETPEPEHIEEAKKAEEYVKVEKKPMEMYEVEGVEKPKPMVETPRGEASLERTAQGKVVYKGVEVDSVSTLRTGGLAEPRRLILIDSPLPLEWIPTPLMADIFYRTFDQRPLHLEGEKHHGKDVLDEVFEKVKRLTFTSEAIPVLVIGRPGYISQRGKRRTVYVERLTALVRRLVKEDILRFAVAMSLQVYKQYCMDDPVLRKFKKHVYVVDVRGVAEKLKGKVPDGALPYLALISSLSPRLLYELSQGRPSRWEPQEYEKTGEGRALAWAVRTIYSKAGPLTVEEIVKAGYGEFLESFKVLGMVEE
ncbi:MAG: hypothetical protein LZ174_08970 [Thaumarchaeota archaeon]|jgi:hypothetical protein|nr:hypothetical protein [Candidatus Geocrenenecus arthurdayi]